MGKRGLVALLSLSFLVSGDCRVALLRGAMGFFSSLSVVFPDYTHLLIL